MAICILIGLVGLLVGGLTVFLLMRSHTEGAIYIVDGNAYLQLNHEPEKLADHQFVTFMVITRK